jgi:Fur family ferric uptake transcriptional regulator
MTRQRRAVLEELARMRCHPTADEVYHRVRQRLPKISLATVYRNLQRLCEDGQAECIDFGGQMRFDARTDHHCHVRCVGCGRVDDINCRAPDLARSMFTAGNGYKVLGHRFELLGICPECQMPKRDNEPDRLDAAARPPV